jgi:hypothetical protein
MHFGGSFRISNLEFIIDMVFNASVINVWYFLPFSNVSGSLLDYMSSRVSSAPGYGNTETKEHKVTIRGWDIINFEHAFWKCKNVEK